MIPQGVGSICSSKSCYDIIDPMGENNDKIWGKIHD